MYIDRFNQNNILLNFINTAHEPLGALGRILTQEIMKLVNTMSGHEYRFAYSLFGIAGFTWGIIDALLGDNYVAKYYIAPLIVTIFISWAMFEVYICKLCRREVRQGFSLVLYGVIGLYGVMGITSMFIRFLLLDTGSEEPPSNLSPWRGMPLSTAFMISLILTILYIYYGARINLSNRHYVEEIRGERGGGGH